MNHRAVALVGGLWLCAVAACAVATSPDDLGQGGGSSFPRSAGGGGPGQGTGGASDGPGSGGTAGGGTDTGTIGGGASTAGATGGSATTGSSGGGAATTGSSGGSTGGTGATGGATTTGTSAGGTEGSSTGGGTVGTTGGGTTGGAVVGPPRLRRVDPSRIPTGAADLDLHIYGDNFAADAFALIADAALFSRLVGPDHLVVRVPAARFRWPGTVTVRVRNPDATGGLSGPLEIQVEEDVPAIAAVDPPFAAAGSPSLPIAVRGGPFGQTARVVFNGLALDTRRESASVLYAEVPSTLLRAPHQGVVSVQLHGGAPFGAFPFEVRSALPVLESTLPAALPLGGDALTLRLRGSGLSAASTVYWNGVTRPSRLGASGDLEVSVAAEEMTAIGEVEVYVTNPPPGGGRSASLRIFVEAALPVLSSIAPAVARAAPTPFELVVKGDFFYDFSRILVDTEPLSTRFISKTELRAEVPAALASRVANLSVRVETPAPGGGTTQTRTLALYGAAACGEPDAGVLVLGEPDVEVPVALALDAPNAPVSPRSATGTCPPVISNTDDRAFQAIVIRNDISLPIDVAAWAVCVANADATIAFFAGSRVPVTDDERKACIGRVHNGQSPESGGAQYCPGAVGTDRLRLDPCGQAVVYVQLWQPHAASKPAPSTVKLKAGLVAR